jgi:hypothetical protein
MLTKSLLLAIVAVCGVSNSPPPEQPLSPPEDGPEEDQHFCCESVDLDKWKGTNCVAVGKENIAGCTEVLYCSGDWGTSGSVTKCR